MNRREFVVATTASVCAVPLIASGHDDAAFARTVATLNAYVILYDTRFPGSRLFGAEVARRGGPARAIDGDITRLWFEELAPRWQRGVGTIAGMTTGRTLLCLEQLAWDHRLRVTSRVEVDATAPHALVSWIIAT